MSLHNFTIAGTKFLCSEVIAPIRSEIDDISLYIINFEDLSNPQQADSLANRFSKCKYQYLRPWLPELSSTSLSPTSIAVDSFRQARASFRQSLKFGNIRDRGLRLAGYLTPPSDVTQEEEEGHEK